MGGLGSSDIVIAVIDDGCQVDHPAFEGRDKFVGAAYRVAGKWRLGTDYSAFQHEVRAVGLTHGTSVATLVAATGRNGTTGVAPNCRLLPIRMPMRGGHVAIDNSDILSILDLVSAHADIAIVSWSRLPLFIPSREVMDRWREVADVGGRRARGVLFLMPAGNSNCPIAWESSTETPYAIQRSERETTILASRTFRNLLVTIPNIFHISAISSLARRTFYSCYGPGIDLCAPSSNSRVFTGDRIDGHGLGLTTSYGPNGEVTDAFKGTSGSAALVGGVAALTLSVNPGISAGELSNILTQTASKDLDFREPTRDIPNRFEWELSPIAPFETGTFDKSGWSNWFGYGMVNAHAAVRRALNMQKDSVLL